MSKIAGHTSFFKAEDVMAEGVAFCKNPHQVLTGQGSQIIRHDLESGSEPEVVYENEDTEENFKFKYMSNDRLLVFLAEKIVVIDLANDNEKIMEVTKDDLECDTIYGEDDDGGQMFHGYFFNGEKHLIMLTNKEIHRLDLSAIDDKKITSTHKYTLEKPDTSSFSCAQINEDLGRLYISIMNFDWDNDDTKTEVKELSLDTLEFKRNIGPGIDYKNCFYFEEKQRKLFWKDFQ